MCNLYSIIIIIGLFNSLKADICIYSHSNGCNNCDISYSLQNLSLITASRFNDDATFKVCSNPLTLLDQVIILQNVKNIIFSSQENSLLTIIDCQHTNGGLEFGNISNLLLYNLIVQDCGALHARTSQTKSHNDVKFQFSSSIYILDCLNVLIKDTSVIGSNGTGLSVIDTNGYVNITNCTFQGNKVTENISFTIPGGGGLYVELTMSCYDNDLGITCNESLEANRTSYIKISNSEFTDNIATTADIFSNTILGAPERNFHGFGRGGGLSIHLRGSFNNVIVISNCNFSNNSAVWGGGLYTTFHDFSYNNSVVIKDTTFKENYSEKGGGGASTGYLHSESSKPEYNSLILIKCQFLGNVAEFGGGISLYSSRSYDYTDLHNDIKLYTCTWTGNTGSYGAAVDVSTDLWDTFTNGFLPAPIFSNCSFTSNYISTPAKHSTIFTSFAKGKGIFLSVGFMIIFKGTTEFEENIGSAMYLISSIAQFSSFSYVHFTKNQGIKGGGIALVGQSALMVTDDSTFTFSHNIAEDRGGAVFQVTLNYKDFITTRSCFIQYFGKRKFIEERNIVFSFNNNTAGDLGRNNEYYGHSMFVSTLYPCFYGCSDKKINNYNETFECIGDFKFVNRSAYEISTYCREIRPSIELFKPFPIIPGKLTKLPVILKDELSNEIQTASRVYIQQNNSDPQYTIKIDASFIYTSDNIVRLFGTPGKHAKILLETVDIKEVSFSMMIQIQHCPPGYVLETSWDFQKQCLCSSIRNKKNIEYYAGISRCNDAEYQAVLRHGYWVGYIDDNDLGKEENLVTGYCPRGYCSKAGDLEYILPNDTDRAKLDSLICGKYRTKMLCAECRGNFSVYYHSITYKCSSSQLCSVGWIFYIISEILPVTLLFIIILILDLNIASGSFNGFIFFIQVTDIMLITGNGAIYFPRFSENLIIAHNLIIGSFNLKFFNVESWSFCLWYRAQTLDLAAFKYVTILYSFMLVMAVIMVLKFCNVRRYSHRCIHFTLKDTVIHGLSAFLTVCYSETLKVSLILLTPITLRTSTNNETESQSFLVSFYNGELPFFTGRHLLYALPALLFLVAVGLVPPLLLLTYPLCYRLFSVLGIGESKIIKFLCICIPLERLKPFFDAFQSSFKDEYRFFSGLYFIYRFVILLTFSFVHSLGIFYVLVQLELLIIFSIHAVYQPYKQRSHNIIDALVLLDLSAINILTYFNYNASGRHSYGYYYGIPRYLQIVILYLPLLCISAWIGFKLVLKILKCCKCTNRTNNNQEILVSLSYLDTRNDVVYESYKKE